ncbi:MAG: polysaccharide deacetylase family protein [Gammaproteobacteria bacterium]|nr:polysaccharide deacetylase family protein [Gammaproteobacteria bacterium]
MNNIIKLIKGYAKTLTELLLFRRILWSYHHNTQHNQLALTFDDGPSGDNTVKILDTLLKLNIQASFFVTGNQALKHPEILLRIHTDGHIIGNHSITHLMPNKDGRIKYIKEIIENEKILSKIVPARKHKKLIRPPYGYLGLLPSIILVCLGYRIIMWSKDSNDSYTSTSDELLSQIDKITPVAGDILLFHDDYTHTSDALHDIICRIERNGLTFSTLPL